MRTLFLILALASSLLFPTASKGLTDEDRVVYERDLKRIGQEIREALVKKDFATLLRYKLDQGTNDPTYDSIESLKNPNSFRYCYLFDSSCLRRMGSEHGGNKNPFYKSSIVDFFKKNKQVNVEVIIWHPGDEQYKSAIARVFFYRPSFKKQTLQVPLENWPLNKWAKDFVACDFVRIQNRWVYYGGIWEIVVDEGDIG
jgi:hypothetical protein